jgi:WD40 repeat protein
MTHKYCREDSDKRCILSEVRTGNMLMEFKGHTHYIRSFEISNDLRHVMSCDEGGTICIWEKSTGKEVWKNKF